MKFFILFSFLVSSLIYGVQNGPVFMSGEDNYEIFFENRLLAQVNGKPVTIFDVMKKMDVMFYRQYPDYVSSKQARFQFYQMAWKQTLKELIEKELMMADAQESKVEVTASEVRQELERSFGPNIIGNLDKIDLRLEEARAILESEITIRKIMMYKVTGKAYRSINPQDVKVAYSEWSKENVTPETWVYKVLTIRDGKEGEKGRSLSTLISKWLQEGKGDINSAKAAFEKLGILSDSVKITASEELRTTKEEMLPEIREVLAEIGPKGYSEPLAQKSRRDDSVSWKIYYLDEVVPPSAPSFKEVENKLREELLQNRMAKEGKEYIDYLRKHYHVQDSYANQIAEDWEPFSLIQVKGP